VRREKGERCKTQLIGWKGSHYEGERYIYQRKSQVDILLRRFTVHHHAHRVRLSLLTTLNNNMVHMAVLQLVLMYEFRATARASSFGFPPRPKTIAQTVVDFPDPFGPVITLRFSPALNTTFLNVMKSCKVICTILPSIFLKGIYKTAYRNLVITASPMLISWFNVAITH
jgi:hypothetical protein